MLKSVKHLAHLENLSITLDLYEEEHHHAFLQWSFPRLVSCHMALTATTRTETLLLSFMLRHPTLVSFSSPLRLNLDVQVPIPLLSLRRFRGPASLTTPIVGRDLAEVKLSWATRECRQPVEKIILGLKSLTSGEIPFVCSHDYCDDYFTEVLESLSRNISYIKTLEMRLQDPRALDVRFSLPIYKFVSCSCIF